MKRMSRMLSGPASRRGRLLAVLPAGALIALAGGLGGGLPAQAAGLPTVTVSVTASSITVGGALQSGGVNVVSTAMGVKEAGVVLVLLKPGVSAAEAFAFVAAKQAKNDLNNVSKLGSIVFSAEAAPGHASEVQTYLQPGIYVALATQEEGPPRAVTSFAVTASKAPVALPTPQATLRTIEFGFRGPSILKVGELVRAENEGFLVHMDFAFPTKSREAAKELVKLLRAGKERQAGRLIAGPPLGFAAPVSPGAYQQETITAKPGWYVQVCFMDTQDRRSHTLLGMERIIKITK
jgi:hypothetical protein